MFLSCTSRRPFRPRLHKKREIGCTQQTRTEMAGGRGGSRMVTNAGVGRRGEWIPKGLLSFIPKIESSISIQPTTLLHWK